MKTDNLLKFSLLIIMLYYPMASFAQQSPDQTATQVEIPGYTPPATTTDSSPDLNQQMSKPQQPRSETNSISDPTNPANPQINNLSVAPQENKWSNFATNLKACTPSQFSLPNPIVFGMVQSITSALPAGSVAQKLAPAMQKSEVSSQILGWVQNKCHVIMGSPIAVSTNTDETMLECYFDQTDLTAISQAAMQLSTGNFTMASGKSGAQALKNSCKPYNPAQIQTPTVAPMTISPAAGAMTPIMPMPTGTPEQPVNPAKVNPIVIPSNSVTPGQSFTPSPNMAPLPGAEPSSIPSR